MRKLSPITMLIGGKVNVELIIFLGQPNRCCLLVRPAEISSLQSQKLARMLYTDLFYRQTISGEHGLDSNGV